MLVKEGKMTATHKKNTKKKKNSYEMNPVHHQDAFKKKKQLNLRWRG